MGIEQEPDRRILKEMPDKNTLEEFINGMHRKPTVIFDIEKGKFEWLTPKPNEDVISNNSGTE